MIAARLKKYANDMDQTRESPAVNKSDTAMVNSAGDPCASPGTIQNPGPVRMSVAPGEIAALRIIR